MAPDDNIVIHVVMTEPLKLEHKEKFRQLEQMFPKVKFVIYSGIFVQQHITQAFPMTDGWHTIGGGPGWLIQGMAARLLLDKILPTSIHKIIYLDGDILVFDSLRDLWNKLPKENYAVAGVCDGCRKGPHIYPSDTQIALIRDLQVYCPGVSFPFYVHSAVLVFDLGMIRQEGLFPKVIAWMMRYHPIFPDQDAINAVLNGRILECEGKWATFSGTSFNCSPAIQKSIPDAAIIHFCGHPKPWVKPYKIINGRWWQPKRWPILWKYLTLQPPTLWHQYRQASPWKHTKGALFVELFGTWEDCKIFIPVFAIIATIFALLLLGIYHFCLWRQKK
jgi:lipopolysaccharide biosynthesis glycosyltransferase